jgi:tetratricopeptide (TPR) repeat protein
VRPVRALAWALVGLLLLPLACRERAAEAPAALRLLGPFVELGAQLQWLRFQAASQRGEEARALELAESALALDPRATEGWQSLAGHLVFDLASREREPELARRRAWFEAGLGVLARGAERAAHPEELELFRALVLLRKAEGDPELDPGGAPALEAEARAAMARAAEHGHAQARELLPQLAVPATPAR